MSNKSEPERRHSKGFYPPEEYADHFHHKSRAQRVPEPRKGMQLSNKQLKLLMPVVRRELEDDPGNIEWRDMYDRLIKQVGWRMSKPGGQELLELLKDDYTPPPIQVWGKDYE